MRILRRDATAITLMMLLAGCQAAGNIDGSPGTASASAEEAAVATFAEICGQRDGAGVLRRANAAGFIVVPPEVPPPKQFPFLSQGNSMLLVRRGSSPTQILVFNETPYCQLSIPGLRPDVMEAAFDAHLRALSRSGNMLVLPFAADQIALPSREQGERMLKAAKVWPRVAAPEGQRSLSLHIGTSREGAQVLVLLSRGEPESRRDGRTRPTWSDKT